MVEKGLKLQWMYELSITVAVFSKATGLRKLVHYHISGPQHVQALRLTVILIFAIGSQPSGSDDGLEGVGRTHGQDTISR
jgi:hypothetical protein